MPDEIYGFDVEGMGRVIAATKFVETRQDYKGRPARPRGASQETGDAQNVQVTSATATSGYYPGKLLADDLTTQLQDVWVKDVNGNALATGIYDARRASGFDDGSGHNYPVFLVDERGLTVRNQGGGTSFSNITEIRFGTDALWSLTQPTSGAVLLVPAGFSGTITGTVVTDVTCSGNTLTKTTKTLTITTVDGFVTTMSLT